MNRLERNDRIAKLAAFAVIFCSLLTVTAALATDTGSASSVTISRAGGGDLPANGSFETVTITGSGASTLVVESTNTSSVDIRGGIVNTTGEVTFVDLTEFSGGYNDFQTRLLNTTANNSGNVLVDDGFQVNGTITASGTIQASSGSSLISFPQAGTMVLRGTAANSGTNTAHKMTSLNTLTLLTRIVEFHSDSTAAVAEAYVGAQGQVKPGVAALPSCVAGREWEVMGDSASGVSTTKRSKLCLCTSDGAAAYAWQNLATGTIGDATTCGTE